MSSGAPGDASTGSGSSYGDPETRRRVLHATWELVEEQRATPTLARVADRAGVSRQALYLHFGDRAGLLVALVRFMDERLELDDAAAHVRHAPDGPEALKRLVHAVAGFAATVDPVAQVLEAEQHEDASVRAAWRDRMRGRQTMVRSIIEQIEAEGRLAGGWDVETASELCYTLTMPGVWRELTQELGWGTQQYADNLWRLLRDSLLVPG
jgi:AcrR family transcriptional regulator